MTQNLELAIQTLRDNGYTVTKRKPKVNSEFADYDMSKVKNAKVAFPSPVVAATFEDGEYIRMSFATTVGKPLNVGRAVRIAVDAYTARNRVRQRKTIADELVDAICAHADVASAENERDEARAKAIELAENHETFKDNNPQPEGYCWNEGSPYRVWSDTNRNLYTMADNAVDIYGRLQTKAAHIKADVSDRMIAKRMKRVKVPAVTYAHIEIAGKKVATLDLEKVNATAKAKVLH